MRGDIEKRGIGPVVRVVVALSWSLFLAGCGISRFFQKYEDFEEIEAGHAPPTQPIRYNEEKLTLTLTHFPMEPPRYLSARDRFLVEFYFDPFVVELPRIRSYVLWRKEGPWEAWQRLGVLPAGRSLLELTDVAEGTYGLRSSAIYEDGREVAVPRRDEKPLLWLIVDRSAPELEWISPGNGETVRQSPVTLRWRASDAEFGSESMVAEWSVDRGQSWELIGSVPARNGLNTLSWSRPRLSRSTCRLRVRGRDFMGNEASREVEIHVPAAEPTSPALAAVRVSPPRPETRRSPVPASGEDRQARAETAVPAAVGEAAGAAHAPRHALPPGPAGAPGVRFAASPGVPGAPSRGAPLLRRPAAPSTAGLKLLNFDDGAAHPGGRTRYLFFRADGLDPAVPVQGEWSDAPGAGWKRIGAAVPAGDGKMRWQLPSRSTGTGRVRLTAVDGARTFSTTSALPVIIDGEPPVAEIRGFHRDADGVDRVALNCYDRGPAGLEEVTLYVTADGGASWEERPVPDPAVPLSLPGVAGKVGLWVAARDRAGWETPRPRPGDPPRRVLVAGQRGTLSIAQPEEEILRGGAEYHVRWTYRGEEATGVPALVEISPNGGVDWEILTRAPLSRGRALVILPGRDGSGHVLRVRTQSGGDVTIESRTRPFAIDASPPQLEIGPLPGRVGNQLAVPLRITDPGGAGVRDVRVFLRRQGERSWVPLAEDRLDLEDGVARLNLVDLDEGIWEISLHARDRAGNSSPRPDEETEALARIVIDRSPPSIAVNPTAFPFVEGRPAVVEVKFDRADAVPPLVLERRGDGGRWVEMHRWASLPPGDDLFQFRLPVDEREFTARFSIRDRVGNLSYAVLGPRGVEPAIELRSFTGGEQYVAGSNRPILWEIHPSLRELEDELRVEVSYRGSDEQSWHQIYDGLEVDASCVWTLPGPASPEYLLRLRLYHQGELIGESTTARTFRIGARDETVEAGKTASSQSQASVEYCGRAWIQLEKLEEFQNWYADWYASVTRGLRRDPKTNDVLPTEWEKVDREVQNRLGEYQKQLQGSFESVRRNFLGALEEDPRNPAATYGMAQLYLRRRPADPGEAARWLEKTIQLQPGHGAARNDLGAAYIQRGQFASAERVLKTALEAEDQIEVRYNLGLALFYQRKAGEARTHFQHVLESGDVTLEKGDLYYYVVASLIQEGERQEARRLLTLYEPHLPDPLKSSLERALR